MPLNNFSSRTILHGDNLPFLKSMNSNTIDLIATDPPFNKGKEFQSTPNLDTGFQDKWTWRDSVEGALCTALEKFNVAHVIEGSRKSYGDDMGAFLCFMAVRLIECRRILKDTGSIYLHCDPTASHYLKELMDAVFGKENFRNEIVWYYGGGGASKVQWGKKHDLLLYYSKSSKWIFNIDEVRVPHKWNRGQKRADGSERNKLGKIPDDVFVLHGVMPWAKERTGYPTQKPLALYERIIKASSNKGDFILDPFCGCATTCMAAERLERKWIGIDLWDKAHECVIQRLNNNSVNITYRNTPFNRTDLT